MFVVAGQVDAGENVFPDIDEPLRTGAAAVEDSAVVIGIEEYPFLGLDVPHANRDAIAFEDLLIYTVGVPAERVQRLASGGASRRQIEIALRRAAAETDEGGIVWVYFAGHGAASPASGERLLLGDAVKRDPLLYEAEGLSLSDLQTLIGEGGARAVIVVDACYAGFGRSGEAMAAGKRPFVPTTALEVDPNSTVWTAASQGQLAGALDEVRHGAFTYFAVGALRGWADGEGNDAPDGMVTAEEAHQYVTRALAVVQIDGANPRSQDPTIKGVLGPLVSTDGLETGPDLLVLRDALRTVRGLREPDDQILEELERLRERQAQGDSNRRRTAEDGQLDLVAERERVESQALLAWTLVESMARAGGPRGELALRKFVDAYGDGVAVSVGGADQRIHVPLAFDALQWLELLDQEERDLLQQLEYGMKLVFRGQFQIGSPLHQEDRDEDEHLHDVELTTSFLLGVTPVTQRMWREVMGEDPAASREQVGYGKDGQVCHAGGVGDDLPVFCVDWYEAAAFCNQLSVLDDLTPAYQIDGEAIAWDRDADGYRLPTEAEWEVAARAGSADRWAGTDEADRVCAYGNVADISTVAPREFSTPETFPCTDGYGGLSPVGSFLPNGRGFHDMTGSVWEWVWDNFGPYPEHRVVDPTGPHGGRNRVVRGGSYSVPPRLARIANRSKDEPSLRDIKIGFRIARTVR